MDISFATWRILVDIFENKKTLVTWDDLKMLRLMQDAKEFCLSLAESTDILTVSIALDAQHMDQYYVSNAQKKMLEQGFLKSLGKKVAFQFCLYSY